MKLAIVHDFLNQYGGAERVIEVLHELYPEAPIYTSIYLADNLPVCFRHMDIRTSFMQKLPFLNRHFKKYLLLYPYAIKSFDLSAYDMIVSSSSCFAKGITKMPGTCHVCYCYTPMRFAWDFERYIENESFGPFARVMLRGIVKRLKKWDIESNNNVDRFIAISQTVQQRIRDSYQRQSFIIYPPVNTSLFTRADHIGDYYLIVSRLNAYKRIEFVINAFNTLSLPLVIIGDGPYRQELERLARANITFAGSVSDTALAGYYAKCKGVIFPGVEDFGMVPVEAMASGRPVIAYAGGGALETVRDEVTGVFFNNYTFDDFAKTINKFNHIAFDPAVINSHADKFNAAAFKNKMKCYIKETYNAFNAGHTGGQDAH